MKSQTENKSPSSSQQTQDTGSAAFQTQYVLRDTAAGLITGAMAIPLTIGIAIMSDYPIKIALATVAFASLIGWINAWFKPGNFIGSPGVAAGLAPVLALGVASFGWENMAFCIFLTALMQAVIWKFNWQRYLLIAVPVYLVEGLLAGVGLKILLKFSEFTYEIPEESITEEFWNSARIQMIAISAAGLGVFLLLFSKFKDTQPAIPYFVLIIGGVLLAQFVTVPMIFVEDVDLYLKLPLPVADVAPMMLVYMVLFCAMLAIVDVIEQVMSNAAIEKIDPLKRKTNSNNSLLAIWIANMGSSFFHGMTNLDGLAKSTTNKLAGAMTKFSVLIIGSVVCFFTFNPQYLDYLPKFSLAAIMLFTGYKMIAGLVHVTHYGPYALMLACLTAGLVFQVGIFEGLLVAMAIHAIVHFMIYTQHEHMPVKSVVKRYFDSLKNDRNNLQ
ncbi:MAG: SulP family inorganic anion transporter [Nitrosomonas sp.]|jgi:MFS superfamily sulfate permease-like transporter|uniref:SulP family inorganic anion transporter n=1 Tax=Nitrosomonas sp. TaxID=42353 RepID=UPI00271918F0|nr:SulP family inorganic anion transporter [Nitrosomonas sp.]MDO8895362.1 SulP family inorganic anion transporter [Nitrosomonas sp.]MDO9469488.1 SulP family inorganic anion transporter [Nitrosomonas sp.]MDP1785976.1 SulP family inorganic anion transporter [Nitrosomonas sp.]MDP2225411.1 SulP family inorganic anion transporter [Nitrosomonas sp.]MDP3279450.1 SulP family inorganic anion transporter [Nitrosomonas sp.]